MACGLLLVLAWCLPDLVCLWADINQRQSELDTNSVRSQLFRGYVNLQLDNNLISPGGDQQDGDFDSIENSESEASQEEEAAEGEVETEVHVDTIGGAGDTASQHDINANDNTDGTDE